MGSYRSSPSSRNLERSIVVVVGCSRSWDLQPPTTHRQPPNLATSQPPTTNPQPPTPNPQPPTTNHQPLTTQEPRIALVLGASGSMACVMIGKLNGVAPFITMWFLTVRKKLALFLNVKTDMKIWNSYRPASNVQVIPCLSPSFPPSFLPFDTHASNPDPDLNPDPRPYPSATASSTAPPRSSHSRRRTRSSLAGAGTTGAYRPSVHARSVGDDGELTR